ncbi:transcription elongation factor GreB [Arenicella chitinivorans]|uniref:Transcription elongation factor GreB n=1 Tax=Arenicella chitinivorans TaxID=1329800 RepID=A0A918RUJ4_9GAMM|nr:GreA/GreB family elongation factor [Arenicella chitinivorans]GHA11452.1 transcription elongation factor GreB [Arenicella chitinivorans]
MSRWRPPQPRSTAIITPEGYAALEKEIKALWAKRRIVNDALAAAAAEGDRSENAEYIYRKKEQAGIDRRIRYLQKRMPDLQVVSQVGDHSRIFFGARVELEDEQGKLHQYRIVGPDETNTAAGDISIDSPLAKSLLKKQVDDEISINIADKPVHYVILQIDYV